MSSLNILSTWMLKWLAVGFISLALMILTVVAIGNPNTLIRRYWAKYISYIDRTLRSMFIWTPGKYIAYGQLGALILPILGIVLEPTILWVLVIGIIVAGPYVYITRMRQKRTEKLEEQIDALLVGLANALKSIPSISAAFISVASILKSPMADEIDLAIKEMRLGSTLDQALLNMAGRIGSRQLDSALSSIMIGRQVGGNLPEVLETTAATLREMARLEGVVRTKTAEGKMQMWVLAAIPIVVVVMFNAIWEGYFDALQQSIVGYILIAIAVICWILSILLARRITSVDI